MENKKILVGIPAYNEEENITSLLQDLVSQKLDTIDCTILAVSDCSSDKTVELVRSIDDKRVHLIDSNVRLGLSGVENLLIKKAKEYDALIIINGDMRVRDTLFVEKISNSILSGVADISSCSLIEVNQVTLVGKALAAGNRIKRRVFERHNNGDNWFNCHGGARCFSPKFLNGFVFKEGVLEDFYSYLYCKKNNYNFKFISDTVCYYSIPSNFADHLKQARRFFIKKDYLANEFGKDFVQKYSSWPIFKIFFSFWVEFFSNPFNTITYGVVFLLTLIALRVENNKIAEQWDTSTSTRKVAL